MEFFKLGNCNECFSGWFSSIHGIFVIYEYGNHDILKTDNRIKRYIKKDILESTEWIQLEKKSDFVKINYSGNNYSMLLDLIKRLPCWCTAVEICYAENKSVCVKISDINTEDDLIDVLA